MGAKTQQLFLAAIAVRHPPQLGAVGADKKIEAFAVGEFIAFCPLGRVADLELFEGHGGISWRGRDDIHEDSPIGKSTSWHRRGGYEAS